MPHRRVRLAGLQHLAGLVGTLQCDSGKECLGGEAALEVVDVGSRDGS